MAYKIADWREHKYVGGPPDARTKKMQLAHEVRARMHGVEWEMVDLRIVYRQSEGVCGVCKLPVDFDVFTVDHIVPLSKVGPHVLSNLQVAHLACNSRKGNR